MEYNHKISSGPLLHLYIVEDVELTQLPNYPITQLSNSVPISNHRIAKIHLAIASNGIIASLVRRLPEAESTSFSQVLLMVLLGSIELLRRQNLRHYFLLNFGLMRLQRLFRGLLLLWRVEINP